MAVRSYCPYTVLGMCELWPWPWRNDSDSRVNLGSCTIIAKMLSRSNLPVRSYGLDKDFGYVCRVTLTSEVWPSVMSWHTGHGQYVGEILSRYNFEVRSYSLDTDFWYMCTVTLTLEIMGQDHDAPLGHGQQYCVKYYPDPTWQWGVILWLGHGFGVYKHCDFYLGDMNLGKGHDTPLSHWQQFCEILSQRRSSAPKSGGTTFFQEKWKAQKKGSQRRISAR